MNVLKTQLTEFSASKLNKHLTINSNNTTSQAITSQNSVDYLGVKIYTNLNIGNYKQIQTLSKPLQSTFVFL